MRDESFKLGNITVNRVAGQRVGRILNAAREVRDSSPEGEELVRQFSDIYSQPGATVDTVIQCWIIEEQAMRMPVSLALRDCLGATFTADAQEMRFVSNQLETSVPAKTTSFLQVTDTYFSRQFKAYCRKKMDEFRRIEEDRPSVSRATFSPKFGHVIECLAFAQQEMASTDWVLPAFRRNWWLIWRR